MPEEQPFAGQDRNSLADSVLTFDSNLLTPPLSIDADERPPFKPLESDNVSLSMKRSGKSAKQRRRLNRACASSGEVNEIQKDSNRAEHGLSRKSLPDLKQYKRPLAHPLLSEPGNHAWVDQKLQQLSLEQGRGTSNVLSSDSRRISGFYQRPRRWTVPTKARPTHLVCFTNHTKPTATVDMTPEEPSRVTPAMIVLRKATTKKQRAQPIPQTNITFFPPPKFNRTSTTLLSFLRVTSQQSQEGISRLNTNTFMTHSPGLSNVPSPPRRPSVTKGCARPCCSVTAEPAVTNVMVCSARELDSPQQFDEPGHRRFSTKIISDSSIHEIIWDENVISGESNSSSSNISRQPTTRKKPTASSQPRKQSIAVEKLETQLKNDGSDPRRTLPGNPSELHRTHQKSFQSLLNFKFGEAKARTEDSRELPRSRGTDTLPHTPRREMQGGYTGLRDDIKFFPPLRCRTPVRSQEHITVYEQSPQTESKAYAHRKSSLGLTGRSLGESRHMRRKSAAHYYHHVKRARSIAGTTDQQMPLLSQTGLDGFWPYAEISSQDQAFSYQPTSAPEVEQSCGFDMLGRFSISQFPFRKFCEICKSKKHKKRTAEFEREAQALKEAVGTTTTGKTKVSNQTHGTGIDGLTDEHALFLSHTRFDGMRSTLLEKSKNRKLGCQHSKWRWATTQGRNCPRCDATGELTIFSRIAVLEGKVQTLEKAVATTKHAKVKMSDEVSDPGAVGPEERFEIQEMTESREEDVADQNAWMPACKATDSPTRGEH